MFGYNKETQTQIILYYYIGLWESQKFHSQRNNEE